MPLAALKPGVGPPGVKVQADLMTSGTQLTKLGPHRFDVGIGSRPLNLGEFDYLREHDERRAMLLEEFRQRSAWGRGPSLAANLSVAIDLIVQCEDALISLSIPLV